MPSFLCIFYDIFGLIWMYNEVDDWIGWFKMFRLLHVFQALIYPLTVASKSNVPARQTAANKILKNMCEHSNTLVQQAKLVIKIQMSYTHITLCLLLKQYCKFLFRNWVTKDTFYAPRQFHILFAFITFIVHHFK